MKSTKLILGIFFASLFVALTVDAEPIGTSISYQGNLEQSGSPANGFFDFRVVAFDSFEFGNQVGPVLVIEDQNVSNGLVNLDVDLGTDVFDGQRRWIQMEVREGGSTGSFTTLNPRQEIRPTPYALQAQDTLTVRKETLESGTVGDCGSAGSAGSTGSVTFDSAFSEPPKVFMTADESADDSGCIAVRVIGRNSTGFNWAAYGTVTLSACDCFHWLAIGEK